MTELNPNVLYELGYARGNGIPVVSIAMEGTKLPFDIFTYRTVFYRPMTDPTRVNEDIRTLAEVLRTRMLGLMTPKSGSVECTFANKAN